MGQVEELCDLICEEQATQADVDKLATLLRDDEKAQARYLELMDLHHSLRWMRRGEAVAGAVTTLRDVGISPVTKRRSWRVVAAWTLAAAAAVLLVWLGRPKADAPRDEEIVQMPVDPVVAPVLAEPAQVPEAELVATVAAGADGLWVAAHSHNDRIGEGRVEVHDGRLELALPTGGTAVLGASSVVDLAKGQINVVSGSVVTDLPKGKEIVIAGSGSRTRARSGAVALMVDGDRTTWCALRGNVTVDLDRVYTGRPEKVRLTRDESLAAIVGGGLLANVMGDAKTFRRLLAGDHTGVQLANAGFEYPPANGVEAVAAAGWRFQVLPLMNATEMPRDDAVGLMAPRAKGSTPMPPEGRQWAFLAAERLRDGRYFHSATYQELGPFVRGATYEMRATIAATGGKGAPLPFAIGLYGGDPDSQPRVALSTVTGELLRGEHKTVELRFHSPNTNVYFDQHLFVRAELGPPTKTEKTKLLIDKIEVRIVDGGKQ
jgi:hypothetical protein